MKLKIEVNKHTAEALIKLFTLVFNTGASMAIEVDFNSILQSRMDNSFEPTITVEKAIIKIQ
jgi:uncharacterized protein (DUF302 family)